MPATEPKEVLLLLAANDIRAVTLAGTSPGMLDLFEEVDREIPLKGRRWVLGHISVLTPRDIDRIARMGIVLTTHTNRNIYKAIMAFSMVSHSSLAVAAGSVLENFSGASISLYSRDSGRSCWVCASSELARHAANDKTVQAPRENQCPMVHLPVVIAASYTATSSVRRQVSIDVGR
jgi:hypothetical protein